MQLLKINGCIFSFVVYSVLIPHKHETPEYVKLSNYFKTRNIKGAVMFIDIETNYNIAKYTTPSNNYTNGVIGAVLTIQCKCCNELCDITNISVSAAPQFNSGYSNPYIFHTIKSLCFLAHKYDSTCILKSYFGPKNKFNIEDIAQYKSVIENIFNSNEYEKIVKEEILKAL